jgi:hypothetical protein
MIINVQFSETAPVQVTLSGQEQTFNGTMSEQVNIVDPAATLSHTKLLDLNVANQHDIGVVTGLQAALDAKADDLTYITNEDIYNMMKGSALWQLRTRQS